MFSVASWEVMEGSLRAKLLLDELGHQPLWPGAILTVHIRRYLHLVTPIESIEEGDTDNGTANTSLVAERGNGSALHLDVVHSCFLQLLEVLFPVLLCVLTKCSINPRLACKCGMFKSCLLMHLWL